jgi:hypothetical protein
VLKRIGKEGAGDLKVAFGDAGTDKEGNDLVGKSSGNRILVDFEEIDKVKKAYGLNYGFFKKQQAALDAGVVAHESEHAGAGGFFISHFTMSTERTALRTESYTYQGLRNTDFVYGLWDERWSRVDKRTIEQNREAAIEKLAKK